MLKKNLTVTNPCPSNRKKLVWTLLLSCQGRKVTYKIPPEKANSFSNLHTVGEKNSGGDQGKMKACLWIGHHRDVVKRIEKMRLDKPRLRWGFFHASLLVSSSSNDASGERRTWFMPAECAHCWRQTISLHNSLIYPSLKPFPTLPTIESLWTDL